MAAEEQQTAWMCHVCNYRSTDGTGRACSECYKITCSRHLQMTSVHDPETGLYLLQPVCVACQLKKTL